LKKYIYKVKNYIVLQVLFYLIYTIAIAIVPYLRKVLFDNAMSKGMNFIAFLVLSYVGVIAVSEIAVFLSEKYVWKTAMKFENILKKDFFTVIARMDNNKFSEKNVGEYISLQGNDITTLEQDYLTPTIDIIKSSIMIVVYSIVIFGMIDYRIGIILILLSLVVVFVPNILARKLANKRNNYMKQMGKYVNVVKEFFENHVVITGTTRKAIINHHNRELDKTSDCRYDFGRTKCLSLSLGGIATNIIHLVVYAFIAYMYMKKEITVGTAISIFGYVECFISPLQSLLYDVDAINSTKDIREKVYTYIIQLGCDTKEMIKEFNNDIKFENVSVRFDNFKLNDFSFRFEKGKKYAIVGASGSGKSTILNVMMDKVIMENGSIYIDGKEMNKYDKSKVLGYWGQNDIIFSDNFENNISVFNAYDVSRLPSYMKENKYLDNISNCTNLSGGEKKMVGFFRLYLQQVDILVMDEPFSGVDVKTARRMSDLIMNTRKTIIMITHDITADNLSKFDEVLYVKNGQLVNSGEYEEIKNVLLKA